LSYNDKCTNKNCFPEFKFRSKRVKITNIFQTTTFPAFCQHKKASEHFQVALSHLLKKDEGKRLVRLRIIPKKTACKQDFTLLQAIFCGDGRLCVGVYRVEAQSLFFTLVLFTLKFSPKNAMFS